MQKKIIYLILLFILTCSKLPESVGLENDIVIFSSLEDKAEIDFKVNDMFNDYINTPIEENKYNLKWIKPNDFKNYKYYKNIIILSLEHPSDSTIDILYKKFKNQYNNLDLFSLYSLYSENQIILPIGAHNSIEFIDLINKNQHWIKNEINQNIDLNLFEKIKHKSVNDSISTIIKNKFNIRPHIDIDYKILDNYKNFLRIGRGIPYRWLIFSKIDKTENNLIWSTFESILSKNIQGVKVSEFYRTKDDSFYRGLYEHSDSDTGGPLFVYLFDNNINNEVILISGFVNNPGKNKYLLLKELEIIVKNIKENKNEL